MRRLPADERPVFSGYRCLFSAIMSAAAMGCGSQDSGSTVGEDGVPRAFRKMPRAAVWIDSTTVDHAWMSRRVPSMAISTNGTLYYLRDDSTIAAFSSVTRAVHDRAIPQRRLGWSGRANRLAVFGDSLLGLLSTDGRELAVAELQSAQMLWTATLPSPAFDLRLSAGGVHVASFASDSARVYRIKARDVIDRIEARLPDSYRTQPTLRAVVPGFVFSADRNSGLWMFPGDGHLFLWFPSGTTSRTYIPPLRRLGTVAIDGNEQPIQADSTLRSKISLPRYVSVLSDSIAIALYRDSVTATARSPSVSYFVTLVNVKRSQVCADILLPHLSDRNAEFVLVRDTLYALATVIASKPAQRLTRIRYHLRVPACTWLGVQPGL